MTFYAQFLFHSMYMHKNVRVHMSSAVSAPHRNSRSHLRFGSVVQFNIYSVFSRW